MNLFEYDLLDSTNNKAAELAQAGCEELTAVVARRQCAGRGRQGRAFYSPPGENLYLSVVLRPKREPAVYLPLTAFVACCVREAIVQVLGVETGIKWVNDLLWQGKKICGILCESTLMPDGNSFSYINVGIGVNLGEAHFPPELSEVATSLPTKNEKSRLTIARAICARLADYERQMATRSFLAYYRAHAVYLGRSIRVIRGGESREATALTVDEDGALVVRYADSGKTESLHGGEISIRPMG